MDVQTACKRAIRVLGRASKEERERLGLVLQKVKFGVGAVGAPDGWAWPYVTCRTSRVGFIGYVDQSLPSVLVEPARLKTAVDQPVTAGQEDGKLVLFAGRSRRFDLTAEDATAYPVFPEFPINWREVAGEDWRTVLDIVHAAGGRHSPEMLRVVRFHKSFVDATDAERVSVAWLAIPEFVGQVPVEFFDGWPVGSVQVGRAGQYVWARVGTEVRWAVLQEQRAPELEENWEKAIAHGFVVDHAAFAKAVKAGVRVSDTQTFRLHANADELEIRAHVQTTEGRDYRATVPVVGLLGDPIVDAVLVSAKALVAAVKACRTSMLGMQFAGKTSPLSIHSGWRLELLWPRL